MLQGNESKGGGDGLVLQSRKSKMSAPLVEKYGKEEARELLFVYGVVAMLMLLVIELRSKVSG